MRGAYFERAILFFGTFLLQYTVEGIIRVIHKRCFYDDGERGHIKIFTMGLNTLFSEIKCFTIIEAHKKYQQ